MMPSDLVPFDVLKLTRPRTQEDFTRALLGSKRFADLLRFVVFDVPVLAGADLRSLPWAERRERLELLATAFEAPVELSPVVEVLASVGYAAAIVKPPDWASISPLALTSSQRSWPGRPDSAGFDGPCWAIAQDVPPTDRASAAAATTNVPPT